MTDKEPEYPPDPLDLPNERELDSKFDKWLNVQIKCPFVDDKGVCNDNHEPFNYQCLHLNDWKECTTAKEKIKNLKEMWSKHNMDKKLNNNGVPILEDVKKTDWSNLGKDTTTSNEKAPNSNIKMDIEGTLIDFSRRFEEIQKNFEYLWGKEDDVGDCGRLGKLEERLETLDSDLKETKEDMVKSAQIWSKFDLARAKEVKELREALSLVKEILAFVPIPHEDLVNYVNPLFKKLEGKEPRETLNEKQIDDPLVQVAKMFNNRLEEYLKKKETDSKKATPSKEYYLRKCEDCGLYNKECSHGHYREKPSGEKAKSSKHTDLCYECAYEAGLIKDGEKGKAPEPPKLLACGQYECDPFGDCDSTCKENEKVWIKKAEVALKLRTLLWCIEENSFEKIERDNEPVSNETKVKYIAFSKVKDMFANFTKKELENTEGSKP